LRQIGREDLIEQLMRESETMEIEPPEGREKEGMESDSDAIEDVA
jgi:hypothetical protein